MKKTLIGLWGIIQGIIGTAWNSVGLLFILHLDSGPGSKEWEEDKMFIPVGYGMVIIWLIIMIFSYYKLRKSKTYIKLFTTMWGVGTFIYILFMFISRMI